jgi:hypothetical protein
VIAAIYTRKSADQNLADEAKAVTRQVERARAYADIEVAAPPEDRAAAKRGLDTSADRGLEGSL